MFEQTKLILFTAASCGQKGYSKEKGWVPERGNAEEVPVEDCLSFEVDEAEIRALFQLIQDTANRSGRREVSLRLCLHW